MNTRAIVFLVTLLLFGTSWRDLAAQEAARPPLETLIEIQDAFAAVAEAAGPSVVTISTRKTVNPGARSSGPGEGDDLPGWGRSGRQRAFRAQGTGSGVIISEDGWILTNDHVVAGVDRVNVKLADGREFQGAVRRDYRSDLALIKIEAGDLRAARLGDSDRARVGHWAIAIGSPYRYDGTFSVGVISALNRRQDIRNSAGEGRLYPSMIQTDAAINPGSSGGPLLNIQGEVIGINTAIESENGGSVGIGFAIPINHARYVADQLREHGKVTYGYLGVEPGSITPRLADVYKVPTGARVQGEPAPGSPAEKAGIQADDVITAINGKPIRNEADLRLTVARIAPGTAVDLVFYREGKEKRARTTLSEAPRLDDAPPAPGPAASLLGIEPAAVTPDALKKLGLDPKLAGVQIKAISPVGCAADSELEKDDIILRINNTPTPTIEAFKKAAAALKPGEIARILWTGRRAGIVQRRVAIVIIE